MRIVLATIFCRFGSWGLVIKLNFFQTFSTMFGQDLKLEFRQDFYGEKIFYVGKKLVKLSTLATLVTHWLTHSVTNFPTICLWRDADVWLRSWFLVDILKMESDQDLCLNLWYELNPRACCAFGNVSKICRQFICECALHLQYVLCWWKNYFLRFLDFNWCDEHNEASIMLTSKLLYHVVDLLLHCDWALEASRNTVLDRHRSWEELIIILDIATSSPRG